jgi:hypothetical protein
MKQEKDNSMALTLANTQRVRVGATSISEWGEPRVDAKVEALLESLGGKKLIDGWFEFTTVTSATAALQRMRETLTL